MSIYNEWCVERPGTQSSFNPNPGTNHECTTSYELVMSVRLTWTGNTKVLLVLSNLFANVTGINSCLNLLFLNELYKLYLFKFLLTKKFLIYP